MSLRLFQRSNENDKLYLTEDELILIVLQALSKARKVKSQVRKGVDGKDTTPKIHLSIHGRGKETGTVVHSDEDAWEAGKEASLTKASTALKFSSNENAMSSRAANTFLSKVKGSEKHKVPAGGVPLYKKNRGRHVLVGSIGVAGDTDEVDEAIAVAASKGFSAPSHIKSDSVLNIPFQSGEEVEEIKIIETLPSVSPRRRRESPLAPSSNLPPLVVSSESVAVLPALPISKASPLPKAKGSLPPIKSSPVTRSLPPIKSSPVTRSLPPIKSSPVGRSLPPIKSSPVGRSLPPIKGSPLSSLKPSSLPPIKSSPVSSLPPIKSSPVSSFPPIKSSPVSSFPPIKSSPVASSLPPIKSSPLSSLRPSSLPPVKTSPSLKSLGVTSSPKKLSVLTPLKK
jgi:uncharacterized protein GlcG (DUF336 family)